MSSLALDGVSVQYGRTVAVQPIDLEIPSGQWLGLIGPNGAGKSSLLRALVGLADYRGVVTVDGEAMAARSRSDRAALVAYVPQDPIFPIDMSVLEYVLLGRSPYVGYFASESRRDRMIVADVLDRLDLAGFADRRLASLSGGERQRLVIARALATQAPILVLDEPTSALDIGYQQQALELVARLRHDRGLTVIAAMHDLTLAGMYADRLLLLHQGVVVASGRPLDVLTAETLAEFYGVRVTVHHDPDGTVVVVPRRHDLASELD